MTTHTYDERLLTQYLVGGLPEDETARFDKLSLTDDELAEALQAVEKDLVDSYVRGELSGQTLAQFKSFFLASPLRREKVRFAQAFQVFAEKAAAQQVTTTEEPSSESRKRFLGLISGLNLFTRPRLAWQWGLASAALVLLIAGGWLVFENQRLRQQMSQAQAKRTELQQREQELRTYLARERSGNVETEKELASVREELGRLKQEQERQPAPEQRRKAEEQRSTQPPPGGVSIGSFILTPQTRGVGQVATISIPAHTDYLALQLELESDDYPVYRVTLRNQAYNRIVWRSGNLKARTKGESKTLAVSLRAGLLQSQVYVLEVSGVPARGAAEIVGGYPFRVSKQ